MHSTANGLSRRSRAALVLAAASLACAAAAPASAQIYKCVDIAGRTTYQQSPCSPSMRGTVVDTHADPDIAGATKPADVEAAWRAAAATGRVIVGMPKRWVQQALGEPSEIRIGRGDDKATEVWNYASTAQVTQVGFTSGSVAWSRSNAATPHNDDRAQPAPATRSNDRPAVSANPRVEDPSPPATAARSDDRAPAIAASRVEDRSTHAAGLDRVGDGRMCGDVLAELGPPDRQAPTQMQLTLADGATRSVEATQYTYAQRGGTAGVSFLCAAGRVTQVQRAPLR